jgi:glycosyltransferase involved in cell wall biosynthesis
MGFRKKIVHLKFFIDLKLFQPQYNWIENSIVYFGRLSREKGLFTLLDAVKDIPNVNLKIIGEGALKESLVSEIRNRALQNVQLVGFKSGEDLRNEIKKSMFIVVPSTWYENYPFTVVESFALGKPVIGSRIGGITEMIQDHETGMTFEVANAEALREKISVLLSNPEKIVSMGKKARIFVEQELNVERHYENLLGIYKQAIQKRHRTD